MSLGYMNAARAKAEGFTHHASYMGIPCWIGDPFSDAPIVATKHVLLEPVMSLAHVVEQTMLPILFPDAEPAFEFRVGDEIE